MYKNQLNVYYRHWIVRYILFFHVHLQRKAMAYFDFVYLCINISCCKFHFHIYLPLICLIEKICGKCISRLQYIQLTCIWVSIPYVCIHIKLPQVAIRDLNLLPISTLKYILPLNLLVVFASPFCAITNIDQDIYLCSLILHQFSGAWYT